MASTPCSAKGAAIAVRARRVASRRAARYSGSVRSPLVASEASKVSWPNRDSTRSAFRLLKSISSARVAGSAPPNPNPAT